MVQSGQDRKWDELSKLLQNNPEMHDESGLQRKIIIFTEHRDTLNYLTAKIAGVLALMVLLSVFGGVSAGDGSTHWLPAPITGTLWMVAVLTMVLGNIGALLQRNVKRMLAYSSIAQSGYLLIGLISGPDKGGFDAVMFYLLGYGVTNTAMFAVLAASAISLIGMPPLIGFFGKIALFSSALDAGQTQLVVIAAVNSAISAFYYLQLVAVPMLGQPNARTEAVQAVPSSWPRMAAVLCGVGVIVLPLGLSKLVEAATCAKKPAPAAVASAENPNPAAPPQAGN